jgi:hypothetical protein
MYVDDVVEEESRVAATAMLATGTTMWLVVDGDKTDVEGDDEEEEAEAAAEAEHDAHLCAAEVRVKAAVEAERTTAAEAEHITVTEAKCVAETEAKEREATKRAMHWAAEMDKALVYQRDVDRRDIVRCEAAHHTETEHRIERRMTMRSRKPLSVPRWQLSRPLALSAIATEAPYSREMAAVAT